MGANVQEFLSSRRVALVGHSRSPRDFSRMVDAELRRRGYDVVPVHPEGGEREGRTCFRTVKEVQPPVEAALLFVPPAGAEAAVRDCLEAGVRRIWFHRGAGRGSASPEALALCAARGVDPVVDLCPMMVLPGAGWGHRIHGWFRTRRARGAVAAV
ncbi:MAG TPA: CoA-binding protein, partial [Anaeromyxobacteraceae bacterium]|nr:CoA-binding protein [Anaeromyxobacteraceae bacterium]